MRFTAVPSILQELHKVMQNLFVRESFHVFFISIRRTHPEGSALESSLY